MKIFRNIKKLLTVSSFVQVFLYQKNENNHQDLDERQKTKQRTH